MLSLEILRVSVLRSHNIMLDWYRCYIPPILVDKRIGIHGAKRKQRIVCIYGYAFVVQADANGITEIFVSVELELMGSSEWC